MRGRIAICVLGLCSLWASSTAQAQPAPGTIAPPRIYAPAPYDAPYSWPAWGVPAYDYPTDGYIPTGAQYGPGPDGFVTERLPDDRGGAYEETPVDRFLSALSKSMYYRLEYMQWIYDEPGKELLGAPVAGIIDPSQPFQTTVDGQPGTARVPTTERLRFRDIQGIRGTIGVPTSLGSLEGSFFAFQRERAGDFERVAPAPILNPAAQIQLATSTRLNGVISTNLFFYNSTFQIFQTSQLLGGEANWVMNSPYHEGLVVRPLGGFRYLDFKEQLSQEGTFIDETSLPIVTVVSEIDSEVTNRVYAPQIGMRFEWVNPYLTLGFEPKVAFGVNQFDAGVRTIRLRNPGDPEVSTQQRGTKFTPIGEANFYGKLWLRDNLSLFASYQFIVASGISRPANNIFYNDNGPSEPAAVVVDAHFKRMSWQGASVGIEWRFR